MIISLNSGFTSGGEQNFSEIATDTLTLTRMSQKSEGPKPTF